MRRILVSLRVRLILLVLIGLIPASILMIDIASEQRRVAREVARQDVQRMVRPASAYFERTVGGTRHLLMLLSRLPEVRLLHPESSRRTFALLMSGDRVYANIGLARLDGSLVSSVLPPRGPITLADRSYFRKAIRTRRFATGEYQVGRITGKPGVNFGYPVLDDSGRPRGVVFAALNLEWLDRMASGLDLPVGSVFSLIDRHGTILVRYPGSKRWVGKLFPDQTLLMTVRFRRQGVVEANGIDGIPRLYAFAPLGAAGEGMGAYLIAGFPRDTVYSHVDVSLRRNLMLLWGAGLATVAIAWSGVGWLLLNRIDRIVRATKRLSAGDMTARTGVKGRADELDQLAGAFDRMAGSLEAAQERLLEAENDKKRFYREVIRAVTHGKFHLLDEEEIPCFGELLLDMPLLQPTDYPDMRHALAKCALDAGMKKRDVDDLVLAVGEAATNAIKHGIDGRCRIYADADRIIARVTDRGPGIQPDDLPATILQPGFSTKVSLGMGYTLMLELVDQVWLSTGPNGTTVQLEQWLKPEEHPEPFFLAAWEKF